MTSILSSFAAQPQPNKCYLASDANKTLVPKAARVTGQVYVLFGRGEYGAINERFITNPNAAGSIWVTFMDGVVPAANGEDSFEIPPAGSWHGSVPNEVRCVFTAAAMAITSGER
jgi:hypothetical protein